METLADIGEDALIQRIAANLSLSADVVEGAGDDCAVVKPSRRGFLELLKTDCVVEGIHFLPETSPEKVGWKAMARVVSDIASMGGTPKFALITLILPRDQKVSYVEALYVGMQRCTERYGISIVGGETSSGPLTIISVTLTGEVKASQCLRRNGAKVGDAIFVTGKLGGSIRGHHLTFEPRLKEAQWLAANFKIHAMMDVSDGLGKDLPRLVSGAGVGFQIHQDLPVNVGCDQRNAWSDGEDYELLFTVPARLSKRLALAWSEQFPNVPLTKIGEIVTPDLSQTIPDSAKGWEHFHSQKGKS